MGLLDMLGMGGPEGKVRRLQKKASAKFGPAENRQGAIEELGALKTDAAVEALLLRYTFRVDPGITDDEEKARVLALITQAGDVALGPVKRFISRRDEISWPLRALDGLLPEAEVVKFLVEVARKVGGEYSRVPEKKVLLLHALSAHKSPEIAPAVLPFLDDMDDEVQIAAAEVIARQLDPVGREPLIQHFLKAHEGNNARVREALAGLLADSGWDVKGYTPKVEAALPQGYKLDSRGKLARK
ncbi:MAG: HEAT repeat domain-containing protein [Deltaproteobacteria bacterium]|nr:MAG: HEAT repeat domain-containing protein [Deltaproteobacteria bacterium]